MALYNGKNASECGDAAVVPGAYAVGEALISLDDPTQPIERTSGPVFKPEMPFELAGQYGSGATFAQGLVFFQGEWLLYYGCADSFVGVAKMTPPLHATY